MTIDCSRLGRLLRYAAIHNPRLSAAADAVVEPSIFSFAMARCRGRFALESVAVTPAARIRPQLVVLAQPGVEVGLQLFDAGVDLAPEGDPIELICIT